MEPQNKVVGKEEAVVSLSGLVGGCISRAKVSAQV